MREKKAERDAIMKKMCEYSYRNMDGELMDQHGILGHLLQ